MSEARDLGNESVGHRGEGEGRVVGILRRIEELREWIGGESESRITAIFENRIKEDKREDKKIHFFVSDLFKLKVGKDWPSNNSLCFDLAF